MVANFHDQSVFGRDHFDLVFDQDKYLVVLLKIDGPKGWIIKKIIKCSDFYHSSDTVSFSGKS